MGEIKIKKSYLKEIIKLGRLRFLVGGFFLYSMGFLLASYSINELSISLFFVGYAIMLPAHLGLSYSNNYFDVNVDRYNKPNLFSGGSKVLIEKPELQKLCLWISIILMILSIIFALIFIVFYSFSIFLLLFVVFGNLLGWFYSAPPLRLAYNGLGEIANMITMGIIMPGIGYWIVKGSFDFLFYIFAIIFLLYGLHFIISVEMPDMEGDLRGKKYTLVARIGREKSYKLLLFSIISASILLIIFSAFYSLIKSVNLTFIFFMSLIPLIVALSGWFKKPFNNKKAVNISKNNIFALILFILTINIYLLFSFVIS